MVLLNKLSLLALYDLLLLGNTVRVFLNARLRALLLLGTATHVLVFLNALLNALLLGNTVRVFLNARLNALLLAAAHGIFLLLLISILLLATALVMLLDSLFLGDTLRLRSNLLNTLLLRSNLLKTLRATLLSATLHSKIFGETDTTAPATVLRNFMEFHGVI